MAAISVACVTVVLTGCGNWISVTDAGQMGLTVDAAGQPVLAIVTCAKARPVVTMSEGRKKSDPDDKQNVERGGWEARRAFSGIEKLVLAAPSANWKTTRKPSALEPDKLFVIDGGTVEDENASLGGVSFRVADLDTLTPTAVQVNGKIVTWRTFGAYKCH
jgi:hypothetical protein